MLSPLVTQVAIGDELPGAIAWARRCNIFLDTQAIASRIVRTVFVQTGTGEKFFLQGSFEDYKAYPPIWEWYDDNWVNKHEKCLSPNTGNNPLGSMFIAHEGLSLICAPFNRLAYSLHKGPHPEWGSPAQWMTARAGNIYAITIGDMLNSILRDFRFSTGRMQ